MLGSRESYLVEPTVGCHRRTLTELNFSGLKNPSLLIQMEAHRKLQSQASQPLSPQWRDTSSTALHKLSTSHITPVTLHMLVPLLSTQQALCFK